MAEREKRPEVVLRVQEALPQHVGRGIVAIDMQTKRALGVTSGDIVEIEGKRKTAAIVWPAPVEDEGKGIIHMDSILRKNAGVSIGDRVVVRPAKWKNAEKVVLAPADENQIILKGYESYVKKHFLGRPVVKGDYVLIPFFRKSLYVVVSTQPTGIVRIVPQTRIVINEKPVKSGRVPQVTYDDIGGLRDQIQKIREMIELPLKHPELFHKLGIEPPKGVLLYGPPGTGKTLLAKAVANEANAYFIAINGPEIMSKFVGEAEERLRKVFEEAQENAPAIIFIDEIDAIAPKREEVLGEVERRVVAQLLTLMDGLEARGQVIVIAATNRPNAIDPALRRPGRFDREIELPVPDRKGRKEILQIHTRNVPIYPGEDPELLLEYYGRARQMYEEKMKEVEREVEEGRKRLESLVERREQIRLRLADLEKRKKGILARVRELVGADEEYAEARRELRKVEAEIAKERSELERLMEEAERIKKRIEQLEGQGAQAKIALSVLEKFSEIPPEELEAAVHYTVSHRDDVLSALSGILPVYTLSLDDVLARFAEAKAFYSALDALKKAGATPLVTLLQRFERDPQAGLALLYSLLREHAGLLPEDLRRDYYAKLTDRLLDSLAARTHGFVGADLAALVKEAAMKAIRRILPRIDLEEEQIPPEILEQLKVTRQDFEEALKEVKPSALREVFIEVPSVHWDDVGGLEDVKKALKEAVEWPLKHPESFEAMGIKPPRGILLYGPPGTGKTLLAKAVATESEANFISIKGPEILSKWVGESERAIREIFAKARQAAPCVVFIDEIDAIAPRRGLFGDSHVTDRVVNQLLTEMDGIQELKGVVVIAATNRPDIVDPSLLRPGRFDRMIYVPPPDEKARLEILKVHTRNVPLADDVDLEQIAKETEFYTGADLAALVREAAMNVLRRNNMKPAKVTMEDFRKAMEVVGPSLDKDTILFYELFAKEASQKIVRRMLEKKPKSPDYIG